MLVSINMRAPPRLAVYCNCELGCLTSTYKGILGLLLLLLILLLLLLLFWQRTG